MRPRRQAALGLVDDGWRSLEVRIADGEQDHVLACFAPLAGAVVDVPHAGGFDVEAAGERGVAHGCGFATQSSSAVGLNSATSCCWMLDGTGS